MTKEYLTAEETTFLDAVVQGSGLSFYGVYNRLGWPFQQATQTLQALCDKGMIAIGWGKGKTGRPTKFLRPTQKACELLGIPFTPSANGDSLGAPTQPKQVKALCQHHWKIEPANGPTSQGMCEKCGAVGEFTNYIPGKAEGQPVGSLPPWFDP